MRKIYLFWLWPLFALAQDLPTCKTVRLSDIGWTDISATTHLASIILEAIGYEPKIKVLSVPVTLSALKNSDLDVFLGNWIPSQAHDIAPFLQDGSVVQLWENLKGAKYNLAVPKYVFDAGVKDYKDLDRFREKFEGKIYGIGAGNEGNGFIASMIKKNDFSLGDWQLIASSEQGMLVEVEQAYKQKGFIVFLAWSPHPMNIKYDIAYLTGGDDYFGPNYGEAKVYTVTRKNFKEECPNLGVFFQNLIFDVAMEERMMAHILEHKVSANESAMAIIKENPKKLEKWLKDVKTYDGKIALAQAQKNLLIYKEKNYSSLKIPLGFYVERFIFYITNRFSQPIRFFSQSVEHFLENLFHKIAKIPSILCIIFFALVAYLIRRSLVFVFLLVLGFLIIDNLGYFLPMLKSLVLVLLSTFLCVSLGIPLGILGAKNSRFYSILRPSLDMMQTIPTFVFLLPTLMLFGLGVVPGLVSTVIFAIAAPIRLTHLGLMGVPAELKEAADAFGASPWQRLLKVEVPYAKSAILSGITQCIMLSLSMVVIAALVGAEGLGEPVVIALNTVDIAQGIESGLCIVILAIILDRLFKENPLYKA